MDAQDAPRVLKTYLSINLRQLHMADSHSKGLVVNCRAHLINGLQLEQVVTYSYLILIYHQIDYTNKHRKQEKPRLNLKVSLWNPRKVMTTYTHPTPVD